MIGIVGFRPAYGGHGYLAAGAAGVAPRPAAQPRRPARQAAAARRRRRQRAGVPAASAASSARPATVSAADAAGGHRARPSPAGSSCSPRRGPSAGPPACLRCPTCSASSAGWPGTRWRGAPRPCCCPPPRPRSSSRCPSCSVPPQPVDAVLQGAGLRRRRPGLGGGPPGARHRQADHHRQAAALAADRRGRGRARRGRRGRRRHRPAPAGRGRAQAGRAHRRAAVRRQPVPVPARRLPRLHQGRSVGGQRLRQGTAGHHGAADRAPWCASPRWTPTTAWPGGSPTRRRRRMARSAASSGSARRCPARPAAGQRQDGDDHDQARLRPAVAARPGRHHGISFPARARRAAGRAAAALRFNVATGHRHHPRRRAGRAELHGQLRAGCRAVARAARPARRRIPWRRVRPVASAIPPAIGRSPTAHAQAATAPWARSSRSPRTC